MADDRLAIRMLAKRRSEQRVPNPIVRVVLRHRDLAQDDVLLLHALVGRQRRVQHRIREQIDRDRRVFAGQVDVIDRAIEGRVGVDVAAVRLDRRRDVASRAPLGALEQHVLEVMREPGAEVAAFVRAPGFHPHLHRRERGGAIGFQNQREAVRENGALDRLAPESVEQAEIRRGGRQFGHEKERGARATQAASTLDEPRPDFAGRKGFTNASSKL